MRAAPLAGAWHVGGDIRVIRVGGEVGRIVIGCSSAAIDVAGGVGSVRVRGDLFGSPSAERFGQVRIDGRLSAEIAAAGADPRTGVSIRSLRAGTVADASIRVPGGIRSVRVLDAGGGDQASSDPPPGPPPPSQPFRRKKISMMIATVAMSPSAQG